MLLLLLLRFESLSLSAPPSPLCNLNPSYEPNKLNDHALTLVLVSTPLSRAPWARTVRFVFADVLQCDVHQEKPGDRFGRLSEGMTLVGLGVGLGVGVGAGQRGGRLHL